MARRADLLCFLLLLIISPYSVTFAQGFSRGVPMETFKRGELLIQFATQSTPEDRQTILGTIGARRASVDRQIFHGKSANRGDSTVELYQLDSQTSVESALETLKQFNGKIEFAEPNYLLVAAQTPNDERYIAGNMWGVYGDDDLVCGPSGTTNIFGIDAEEAWNSGITGSSDIYVGVIDTGIMTTHPDLQNNIWVNPFDPVDGIDNDGNGRIDDTHGWNFINNSRVIYQSVSTDSHGTHVAGTIGAEGNNGIGVAGVSWNVKMISAKVLSGNTGDLSWLVSALNYMTDLKIRHGIKIVAVNVSLASTQSSQSLQVALLKAAKQGILIVTAAMNNSSNNDAFPVYPANNSTLMSASTESAASYEAVISVASITSSGGLSSFSNFGAVTVDLGAPGSQIHSTLPSSDPVVGAYGSWNGTSMAAPHVTGAIALFASAFPRARAENIRSALLTFGKPLPSLSGKTVTGKALNLEGVFRLKRCPTIEIMTDAFESQLPDCDLNGDDTVNSIDLQMLQTSAPYSCISLTHLLSAWGPIPPQSLQPCDLNLDNVVDGFDLGSYLSFGFPIRNQR